MEGNEGSVFGVSVLKGNLASFSRIPSRNVWQFRIHEKELRKNIKVWNAFDDIFHDDVISLRNPKRMRVFYFEILGD